MRNLIYSIVIFLLTNCLFGQSKYEAALGKLLLTVDTAKSEQDMISLANSFSRISQASPDNWEAYYNNAYFTLKASFMTMSRDMTKAQQLADEAKNILAAGKSKAKSAQTIGEIETLEAYALIAKISEDPMGKGATLSPQIQGILGKVMAMNPNPRAAYLRGLFTLNTPTFYGGGPENATPHLKDAFEMFKTYPSPALVISWGERENAALLIKLESK
jgi:hypothetical protein